MPPVARLRIVERVQNQRITFEWPDGADVVMAYRSPVGLDSALAVQGEPREISKSEYFDRGSLEYRTGGLDPLGCELHLVAVAFDGASACSARRGASSIRACSVCRTAAW